MKIAFLFDLSAEVFLHVPEAVEENYQVLYEIDLPINAVFRGSRPVSYLQNKSGTAPDFDRVAYYLHLVDGNDTHWVYVSMDAFTSDPIELGLPHSRDNPVVHQRTVENLNVVSNVPGVVTGTFLDGGHLEMWPSNYSSKDEFGVFGASDSIHDWGDFGASTDEGYGSFQVHNAIAGQTIFAWNRWGADSGEDDDVGIGNQPLGEADWTFAGNAAKYSSRKLVILVRPRIVDLEFAEWPKNRQLYSRDLATNQAIVPIRGEERFGGFEKITLRVFRNGAAHSQFEQDLIYTDGRASFAFEPTIVAELAKYDFELWLNDGNQEKLVRQVREVVAGDAFIVYGQSNAEAVNYDEFRSANEYSNQWILTFGQNGDDGNHAKNILHWVQAEGDGSREDPGSIGQWPMVLAHEIVAFAGIPVAILNGSRSGYEIRRLHKDREDPDNLYDTSEDNARRPYNRLRYRVIQAGIAESIRALLYYQGEGDNEKPRRHSDGYQVLREDWADDFPGIERFYCTQIRPGCGVTTNDVALREVQRSFGDIYPRTSILPSNGLDGHDTCHFHFTDGYEELGWNYARVVLRDLYGAPDGPDIDPLNPSIATFSDSSRTEIRLLLRNPATVDFPPGALSDFHITDTSVTISGVTVGNDSILFHLSGSAASNSYLEYRSHEGPGNWVTNANGVGMLSFSIPISTFTLSEDGSEISGTDLTPIADRLEAAIISLQLRDENGDQVKKSGVSIVFKSDFGEFPNGDRISDPILTDSNGTAHTALVSTKSGIASITATVEGRAVLHGSPVTVNFLPGSFSLAENATILQGENLNPIADGVDEAEVSVQLRDAFGNPIATSGISVSFATTLGKFSNGDSSVSVNTDENGLATTWLSSTLAGPAAITATIDENPVTNGSVLINFQPGEAIRLSLDTEPEIEKAGDLFTVQPIVSIRDNFGNIVSTDNETEINISIASGVGGTLDGTKSLKVVGGIASFLDLTFGGIVGENYSLAVFDLANHLPPVLTEPFEVLPGPAELLKFLQQPSGTAVHQIIEPPPSVALHDKFGNLVSDEIDTITLTLGENPENPTLLGTITSETVDGIATFSDLKIERIFEQLSLMATSARELQRAESELFAITVGSGYSAWAEILPEGFRDERDDPGGYGIPNILRYAFDLDPLLPEYSALPQISIITDESCQRISIQFRRRTDDPSLIYTIETGDEPNAFELLENPILETIQSQPPSETLKATDPRPITESKRRFMRVRILGW